MRWGERLEFTANAEAGDFIFVPPYVPHQEINALSDAPLECVLVRSDNESVVVNLNIDAAERFEEVYWIDPIHRRASTRRRRALQRAKVVGLAASDQTRNFSSSALRSGTRARPAGDRTRDGTLLRLSASIATAFGASGLPPFGSTSAMMRATPMAPSQSRASASCRYSASGPTADLDSTCGCGWRLAPRRSFPWENRCLSESYRRRGRRHPSDPPWYPPRARMPPCHANTRRRTARHHPRDVISGRQLFGQCIVAHAMRVAPGRILEVLSGKLAYRDAPIGRRRRR